MYTSKLPTLFRRISSLLLLSASLAAAADEARSPGGQDGKRYHTALGDVEITLIPDKPEVMIGEPVYLSFTVRNRSDHDLQTVQGGDYRGNRFSRPGNYTVTAVDPNGLVLPNQAAGPSMGGLTGPQEIPAQGTWTRRLFLPCWVTFATAGDHRLSCRTVLKLSLYTPGRWDYQETTTALDVEVKAPLKVVPTDEKRMGELIEKLGKGMLASRDIISSNEVTFPLCWIDDERVIPFFIQAAMTDDYSLRFIAMDALAKFRSDDALRGIKIGLATQAADLRAHSSTDEGASQSAGAIRHAAAVALSRSPHPGASKLLLSLWQDPCDSVRLTVLHALGMMDSAESLELLRKMSTDPDEQVRSEALRYLKLRTEKP